jgi:soluble lytic murein transglycosylase-like protein
MKKTIDASIALLFVCTVLTLAAGSQMIASTLRDSSAAAPHPRIEQAMPAIPTTVAPLTELSASDQAAYRRLFALSPHSRNGKQAAAIRATIQNPVLLPIALSSDENKAASIPAVTPSARNANSRRMERFGTALLSRHLADNPMRFRIQNLLENEQRTEALRVLDSSPNLSLHAFDLLRWQIAASFYNHGEYPQAARLAHASAIRSGSAFPALHWIAGIAAWHQQNYTRSYQHFTAMLAKQNALSAADTTAAAFWAYRAAMQLHLPLPTASAYLAKAAQYPDSFYGIQALALLTQQATTAATAAASASPSDDTLQQIRHHTPIRRIIALHEIGDIKRAEQALLNYFYHAPAVEHPALFALATRFHLLQAQQQIALALQGVTPAPMVTVDSTAYPAPRWHSASRPSIIEPSLVLAITKQESGFSHTARSEAGATGLMQLLPETARYLVKRVAHNLPRQKAEALDLSDPTTNIVLGQYYIRHLQQQPAIQNNLVYLLAAYNAGIAPVISWKQSLRNCTNDPLLFIESIPFAETRSYVLNVLRNYWMYQKTMPTSPTPPRLALLAAGEWPLSQPLSTSKKLQVAHGATAALN